MINLEQARQPRPSQKEDQNTISVGLEPIKESKESMSYTYNSNPMNASSIARQNATRPDMNPTP